jgi:hypothetical protein
MGAFLCRRLAGRFFFLHPVDQPDDQEDCKRNDKEIDHGVNKNSVINGGRSGLLGYRQRWVGLSIQADKQIGEIDTSKQQTDGRHQDIVDERNDDSTEGYPNDHGNRQIKHITSHHKFLKFVKHGGISPYTRIRKNSASPPGSLITANANATRSIQVTNLIDLFTL